MPAIPLVPPASEPLTLGDAKAYLRVDIADDDALIAALIAAARRHVEVQTRCALLLQTWRITLDAWPRDGRVVPRIGPLQTLVSAEVMDAGGHAHAIDPESFVVDVAGNAIAAPCFALPAPGRSTAGITLDVVCGFGAAASDVPADLRQAMLMLIAAWYDRRGADSGAVPAAVTALIAPYARHAL